MKRAAGFVIFRKISNAVEYLLLQTSYGEHHWTPPKGHVDEGEHEMQTAQRETEEEAGLKLSDLNVYENSKQILKYDVNDKPKVVYYWLAQLLNPHNEIKLSEEHQDYKWLSLEDACTYGKYPDMQEMLQKFHKYIEENKL